MDRNKLVSKLNDKGLLASPEFIDALSKESEESVYQIINDAVKINAPVLSKDIFDELKKKACVVGSPVDDYCVVKILNEKLNEISTQDFIDFYSSKYELMKKIISERIKRDFISLNKLSGYKEAYVMGIVREIKKKDDKFIIELEDLSGSCKIIFNDDPGVEYDDIVAIKGNVSGDVVFGKQVLWPDVPLRESVVGENIRVCFVSDLHLNEVPVSDFNKLLKKLEDKNIDTLFVAGDIGDVKVFNDCVDDSNLKQVFIVPGNADSAGYPQLSLNFSSDKIISLSNPSIVLFGGLNILIIHNFDKEMLKKRYLGKSKEILPKDYLVLNNVPDIVHYGHTHEPFVENYKAITLVNSGSLLGDFKPVVINFKTREVGQL